jgi:hypothetical protein
MHLARFLATRLATPLILTGTMALAAGGAVATAPAHTQQYPTTVVQTTPLPIFPNIGCHPGWYGTMVCHIPTNQVALWAPAYSCSQDWHGDDLYVCHFMSN